MPDAHNRVELIARVAADARAACAGLRRV